MTTDSAGSVDAAAADVTITSRDMSFDLTTITVAADKSFTLRLVNLEGAPHNIAIYVHSSATESLFVGDLITNSTTVYDVPALEQGTYFFRCDLHPEMNGTIVVEG